MHVLRLAGVDYEAGGRPLNLLRPYQVEAVAAVHRELERHRSALLVLPTGCGKTLCAGHILRERARRGRVLWLAHRSELLDQARETIEKRIGLGCELEKAESRASQMGGLFGRRCVVASVQSMRGQRLKRWPADSFATIVVDECHHSVARGYREILSHFGPAKVLGLTATPDRGDGVGLGAIFDVCAFQYDIRQAIRDGYLCPIVQKAVECADLDLSDVKTVAGDLAQGELEQRLRLDSVLHQVAAPLVELAGDRPTIVFTAGVQQAHALVEVMAGYTDPRRVAAIDGGTPDEIRRERIAAYRQGDVQFLVNCAVLTEGFDAPETACVAMARPTKSRALYAQAIGRGTRIAPGKTDCLVLDFQGNAGRHRLVSPLDVLAGRPLPPDVERRAKQLTAEGKPSEEALAQAEAEAVERERRAEERRQREARIKADVAYRARQVDPFGIVGHELVTGPRATEGQLQYLAGFGVEMKGYVPSRSEASHLINHLRARSSKGLCSYKQARLLAKHGLTTDVSRAEASKMIDAIANNGWRAPEWLMERYADVPEAAE